MADYNTEDYSKLKISELKKMTDYWMRRYLLSKAKRNGYNQIFCPIKKKWYSEDYIHLSHFIDRGTMNTRYDIDNCHLLSSQSNLWDSQTPEKGYKSKHHKEYEEWLKNEIGEKKFIELLARSKELRIFAREDYIKLIERFRNDRG